MKENFGLVVKVTFTFDEFLQSGSYWDDGWDGFFVSKYTHAEGDVNSQKSTYFTNFRTLFV